MLYPFTLYTIHSHPTLSTYIMHNPVSIYSTYSLNPTLYIYILHFFNRSIYILHFLTRSIYILNYPFTFYTIHLPSTLFSALSISILHYPISSYTIHFRPTLSISILHYLFLSYTIQLRPFMPYTIRSHPIQSIYCTVRFHSTLSIPLYAI